MSERAMDGGHDDDGIGFTLPIFRILGEKPIGDLDALTHAHWLFSERDIDRRRGEGIIRKMASLSSFGGRDKHVL
jgi:hypothetical protein